MARWEFEAIYKAFSRMVYWAAYGVTKSESDAGDVTQETFIRALKYADKLKDMEEAQIKAWLYRVCINLCMDNKRKLKREQLSDELPETAVENEAGGFRRERGAATHYKAGGGGFARYLP